MKDTPTPRSKIELAYKEMMDDVQMSGSMIAYCMKDKALELERELTAVWENIAQYAGTNVSLNIDLHLAKQDIVEITEQRDRLAEALEQLMTYQPRSTVIAMNERNVWSNAKEALQSLNQPTP